MQTFQGATVVDSVVDMVVVVDDGVDVVEVELLMLAHSSLL